MSGFKEIGFDPLSPTLDAASRIRVGQLNTLIDLKTIGHDEPLLLENTVLNVGGGSTIGSWSNNMYNMSMTAAGSGSYIIRRSKHFCPYLSGKSKPVEISFSNFNIEPNIIKRTGYWCSNNVTPYDSSKDGFWLESDGTNIRFIVQREGVQVLNKIQSDWNGDLPPTHDWSKFNAILMDFLWLGGAALRLYVKTDDGFILAHTYTHAGNADDLMIRFPTQNIRWEMRATGSATGTFKAICGQVASEGSLDNAGKIFSLINTGTTGVGVTYADAGKTYAVIGIKKSSGYRNKFIQILNALSNIDKTDRGILSIHLNPVLTPPLSYVSLYNSSIDVAIPSTLSSTVKGTCTITNASPAVVTLTSHGLITGALIRLSTTGTLPSPLQINTDYYVIFINTDTFNLATSYNNAINNIPINTNTNGSGTHSLIFSPGTILDASPISGENNMANDYIVNNFLNNLGSSINDTSDELVVCITPSTSGLVASSVLKFKEI